MRSQLGTGSISAGSIPNLSNSSRISFRTISSTASQSTGGFYATTGAG